MKRTWLAAALAISLTGLAVAQSGPSSTKPLVDRMKKAGRAEVRVVVTTTEPGGSPSVLRGTLVMEPPDRVRLDYGTGERLTARADGGEWLQPGLRQMLVMDASQASQAASMWDVLRGGSSGFVERQLTPRTYRLVLRGATAESVRVSLGNDRLPSAAETVIGDVRWVVRFSNWRFLPARGRGAFVLKAPAGYETVSLP